MSQLMAWTRDANPARLLAILEQLKDDPTRLVRRSVASNLNDLSRSRPELVVETCRRWSENGTPLAQWLVRHALRSLVKNGHSGALLGTGERPRVVVAPVRLSPTRVRLGEQVRFSFRLESCGASRSSL